MLQVQDHTLGKVHKVVVVNYLETLYLVVGVEAMHKRLVEEEHRVGVACGTDRLFVEAAIPLLQVGKQAFHC